MGLGLGVIVYHYGVLGFGFHGGLSTLLTGIAIGAIVGGGRLLQYSRAGAKPGRPRLAAVLLLLVGVGLGGGIGFALAPPSGYMRLHARQFPGLIIDLPSGEDHGSPSDYDSGQLLIGRAGGFGVVTGLGWQVGGLLDDDETKLLVAATGKMLGASVGHDAPQLRVGGGLPSRSLALTKDGDPGVMSMFTCGRRLFTVFTLGPGAERLHQRVLASVACHPDPAHEAAKVASVPVLVELPSEWTRTQDEPTQLTYEAGDQMLTFLPLQKDMEVPKLLDVIFQEALHTSAVVTPLPAENGRELWSLEVKGESPMHGVAARWTCAGQSIVGIFAADPAAATVATGKTLLLAARCK